MDLLDFLLTIDWRNLSAHALKTVLTLLGAWVLARLAKTFAHRIESAMVADKAKVGPVPSDEVRRIQTLMKLLRQIIIAVIWTMAGLVALGQLGVDIGPLLAGAGVVGLAVGFGAQNLIRDLISGFFMILEDQIRVGDFAIINGVSGQVEKITLRTIVLRDVEGVVHVFPNGTISSLANRSSGWSAYVSDVGVAYKEDPDKVFEVIREVAAEMKQDANFGRLMLEDAEILGVDRFADSAVVIRVRLKTVPLKQWVVGREFNRRLKKAFDREGIEIPFPHVSLYAGEATKPIPIRIEGAGGGLNAPLKNREAQHD